MEESSVPSFDVVSKPDLQEVVNAVQQTRKEVAQRYDLKSSNSEIELEDKVIKVDSADEFNVKAVVDVLQSKMVKRGVDLKFLEYGKIEPAGGGRARQTITVHQGLETEAARDLVKRIKATGIKVQAQIQDDQVRVTGKKRDDLQAVIQALRGADFSRPLQFVNMRD
jgi:cyclic-di-GMP-binding protein